MIRQVPSVIALCLCSSWLFAQTLAPPTNLRIVAAAGPVVLSANPTTLGFGNVGPGSQKTLPVSLSSVNASVTISNVTVSGSGFSVNGVSAGQVLVPGNTATLNVVFAPTTPGNVTGTVTITSSAANSPTTIPLTGAGSSPATILWSADHEAGNVNEWIGNSNGYDGCWFNSGATCWVTTAFARTGLFSATMTTTNYGTTNSGARLMKTQTDSAPPLPTEAYYSAWYRTPPVTVPSWLIIMQWKVHGTVYGSDPTYTVNIFNPGSGRMALRLYKYSGNDGNYNTSGQGYVATASRDIPTDRWWHLECFYKWATTPTGQITCWQDGVQIFSLVNVQTQYNYGFPSDGRPLQWGVAAYADNTNPGVYTVYADDVAISTGRLGPGF